MKRITKKLSSLAVACAMVVSLAGCGVSVTGVSFDIPDTLERGSSIMATPEYAYDGETPEAAKADELVDKLGMSYTSSDPNVLTVDENGNITAVGIGTAEVAMSSKDGKITTSKVVEVVVTPVSLDMVDRITLTKEKNSKAKLEAVVQPEDATHVEIEFTSSNEDVATVNSDGEINAVDVGEATITASIKETDLTAECVVTVVPDIESIELSDTSLKLKKDGTAQLTATANPEGASIDGIAFASDAPDVATVDEKGNVTAIADGKATITASVGDVSAECVVTVDSTVSIPKTGSNGNSSSGSASSGTNGGSNDTSSSASAPAASSSFEYGALPMDPATDGETWWNIDSSDSAYWAVANNINAMRAEGGLSALTVSSSLSSIAHDRCVYLIANDVFSHDGATTAEILCSGATSASAACTGWKNSPSHYSNIMTPGYTQMGIACTFNTAYGVEVWCVTFS
jgi:uncharacterized protein YjdB